MMKSYSRRQLEAFGEPIGDSSTHRRAGDRKIVMGGGGGTAISNWGGMNSDALTPWQQSVWANSKDAAAEQAKDNAAYRSWYGAEAAKQRAWYSSQRQQEITWQQLAMIAVKTAIDLTIADQMDKRMRDIARDQRDLANRQMKMGEELHSRYINKFAPIEDAAADFAHTDWQTNRYKPQYQLQQGRAKLDASRAFGKVQSKLSQKMSRYCTGANANMIRQTLTDWAKIEVDMVNRAWHAEQLKAWDRDREQWKRVQDVIANGQRLPAQAASNINAGVNTMTESNAIRGQAMQGWYGALAKSANGLFQFGFSTTEQQRAAGYAQLPGMTGGSLGGWGMQMGPSQNPSYDLQGFEQYESVSPTGAYSTADPDSSVTGIPLDPM